MKTLDRKLGAILRGSGAREDFIIADAKDADMGGGRPAPGPERGPDGRPLDAYRPLAGYLDEIRAVTRQGIVDVMLVSVSTLERIGRDLFAASRVTPAVRVNDTTDVWGVRGGAYPSEPSRPFRTASLARARDLGCDLGLYSITFNNRVEDDLRSLEAFAAFREEAEWRRRLEEEYLRYHREFRELRRRIPAPGWRAEYAEEIRDLGYDTVLGD